MLQLAIKDSFNKKNFIKLDVTVATRKPKIDVIIKKLVKEIFSTELLAREANIL